MRILMIIDGLPGGGAEKTVLTLSSGLTELGHQVTLFLLTEGCATTPFRKASIFRLCRIPVKNPGGS